MTIYNQLKYPASSIGNSSIATGAVSPDKLDSNAQRMGFKNRIINGAMVIDQRNNGASVTPASGAYTLDRWVYNASQASKVTIQQNAGSVTPPAGFKNYLGLTVGTSANVTIGAGDYFDLEQRIEGYNIADLDWGTANAKTVTLSFQVRSSLTGTFGGALRNSGSTRSYPFSYSIPVANTWTPISITITGDTSGTWLSTNGVGIYVGFALGYGSTYGNGTAGAWVGSDLESVTGAVSVVSTNSATFYITGVQLEVGSSATGFEYRQYDQELILCKRYYNKSYDATIAPGTASVFGCTAMRIYGYYPLYYSGTIYFGVPMRVSPTMVAYNPVTGASGTWTTAGAYSGSPPVTFNYGGNISIQWQAGDGYNNQDFTYGQWTATAEL